MKYGERLRLARKYKNLSQAELAIISGVKQGTISKIERNGQNYSGFDAQLSDALDIHAMWLRTEEEKFAPGWLNNNSTNHIKKPPPVIQETAWQSLPPQTRILIEDILNKTIDGRLTLDHMKILQNIIDALTN